MARGDRIRQLEGSHRYGLVLVLIILPIAFSLAAPPDEGWARALTVVLFAVAIIVSLAVAHAKRRMQLTAQAMLVLVAISAVIDAIVGSSTSGGVTRAVLGLLIALAPFALARGVIRHLRAERTVTLDAVYGAIAIYLLIGAFFATIDAAVGQLGSDPFFSQLKEPAFEVYMYFSYVTLATVGYGDFTPATSLARALAVTEALAGQLYLVTIVAVLVSNVGRRGVGGSG
ncbi:MAG: potassium channel family protein [Solirubrobacteraceae bacterium]